MEQRVRYEQYQTERRPKAANVVPTGRGGQRRPVFIRQFELARRKLRAGGRQSAAEAQGSCLAEREGESNPTAGSGTYRRV